MAIAFICFICLGNWQIRRGYEKIGIREASEMATESIAQPVANILEQLTLEPSSLFYRKILVQGIFQPQYNVILDNQLLKGQPGYNIITPVSIAPEILLLINRGFVPQGERKYLPVIPTLAEPQSFECIIEPKKRLPFSRNLEFNPNKWPNRVAFLDFPVLEKALSAKIPEVLCVVYQPGDFTFTLTAPGKPGIDPDRHFGYAFQWYAIAALVFVISIYLMIKFGRIENETP